MVSSRGVAVAIDATPEALNQPRRWRVVRRGVEMKRRV